MPEKTSSLVPAPICPWCGSEMFVTYYNRLMAFGHCQYACACGATAPVICVEYAKPKDWDGIEEKAYAAAMNHPISKPLTWEQLTETDNSVWFDNGVALRPMMITHSKSWSLEMNEIVYGVHHSFGPFVPGLGYLPLPIKDYGRTWLCWRNKPATDDRRAAWKEIREA